MVEKLKSVISNHRTLISNFSYLSILQILNMLIPLITYPYLIRVIGKETYGLVVFAQAIIGYLVIVVSFGFNISATKEVSIHRNNKIKLNEIISSTLIIKSLLCLISLMVLSVLIFFIPQAKEYYTLFFLTSWLCIYEVIFPIWYFQGIEKMKYITYITLLSRFIFLGLIFVFIHTPSDYLFIPIINGIGALFAGGVSLYIIFRVDKISFKFQPISVLKHYITDSFPIFISNLSTTLYLTTNKVILGIFVGMQEVAYYDLAEKLSTILKTPIQIIGQTIYPKVAHSKDLVFVRTALKYTLLASILIVVSAQLFGAFAIEFIGGIEMLPSSNIFRILSISILPITISLYFANIILISWGYNKPFLKLRLITNGMYITVITILIITKNTSILYFATLSVFTEIVASVLSVYYCQSLGIIKVLDFVKNKFVPDVRNYSNKL